MNAKVCFCQKGRQAFSVFVLLILLTVKANGATFYSISAGQWNNPSNWATDACGGVAIAAATPQAGDDVIICSAITYNIVTATIKSLTIRSGGALNFNSTVARTLIVTGNVDVQSGGILQNLAGFSSHVFEVQGNFSNNGDVNFYKSATNNVAINFTGSANTLVTGSGTWNLFDITMNKGATTIVLEIQSASFYTNFNSGAWTLTRGTYYHNNAQTLNLPGTGNFTINNNTVLKLGGNGKLNLATGTGGKLVTLQGGLEILSGIVTVGTSSNTGAPNGLTCTSLSGSIPYINISGGQLNVFQGLGCSTATDPLNFTMSGGLINLNYGTNISATETFSVSTAASSRFVMSGGRIVIHKKNGSALSDFNIATTTVTSTGGTIQFGDSTNTASTTFMFTPYASKVLPNFKVSGQSNQNITLCPRGAADFQLLSLFIDKNKTFDIMSGVAGSTTDGRKMTLTSTFDGTYAFYDDNAELNDHFIYRQGMVAVTNSATVKTNLYSTNPSLRRFYDLSIASSGKTVSVTNDFGIANELSFNGGTLNSPSNNLYLYSSAPLAISAGSQITLSYLIFNGGNAQSLPGYNYNCSITIQSASTTVNQTGNVTCLNLRVNGNGNTSAASIDYNTGTYTLHVLGDMDIGVPGGGTAGAKKANCNSNNITVDGNFTINTDGAVNTNSSVFNVGGNWTNLSSSNPGFTVSGATLNFIGTGDNILYSNKALQEFWNLGINKASKGTVTISNTRVGVMNSLSFTAGYFVTTPTNRITVYSSAAVSGASDNSHVNGPVQKLGIGAFNFPIGDGTKYRPLGTNPASSSTEGFTAQYFGVGAPQPTYDFTNKGSGVQSVSNCEYWSLSGDPSAVATRVKLSYGQGSCGTTEYASYKVIKWTTQWTDLGRGGPGTSGNATSGFVESTNTMTTYGIFTLQSCAKPTVSAGGALAFCSGGSVTLTSSTGATYLWSTGQTTNAITVSSTGKYTVTITGSCTSTSDTVSVTVNPLPPTPAAKDTFICGSGVIALPATGSPNDYKWYDAATNGTLLGTGSPWNTQTLTTTTNFYVASTSAFGCESATRTRVIVSVNAIPPDPTAPGVGRCDAGSITLSAWGSIGSYKWYAASSGGSPINFGSDYVIPFLSTTTTYYVSAISSGCEGPRKSITATINALPSAPTGIDGSRCGSGTVSLSASGSPSGYNWYSASSGGTSLASGIPYTTNNLSSTTIFYVSSVSSASCESATRTPVTATINTIPSDPIAGNGANCGPGAINLSVSGSTGTYQWYDLSSGGVLVNTGSSYTTPVLSATTSYYVSVLSPEGCPSSNRSTVTATINPVPPAPSGVDGANCGPGTVNVSASGSPGTYNWYTVSSGGSSVSTGANYTTPSISATTLYYVTSVNAQNCESSTRTLVTATINTIPSSPTGIDGSHCGPGSVNISASGSPGDYIWYTLSSGGTSVATGSGYTTPVIVTTTSYYVSSLSPEGCESNGRTTVIATINSIPGNPVPGDGSNCGPGTVNLSASGSPGNYQWYDQSSAGTLLASTAGYTTPSISTTTTYYVASELSGCLSSRIPVTATINSIPGLPSASDEARCGTGTLDLSASGSAGTYHWYDAASGGSLLTVGANYTTPSISATTNYYVTSLSPEGCESSGRKTVIATVNSIPGIPTAVDGSNCGPGSVNLSVTGTADDYSWFDASSGGTLLQTGASYTTPSISGSTIYYVSSNSIEGCESTGRVPVTATIKTIPGVPTPVNGSNCGTGTVNLSASGSPANYRWYDQSSGGTLLQSTQAYTTSVISSTTNYYVVSEDNGCESSRTLVVATINPVPADPSGTDVSRCGAGTVNLSATGSPNSYQWYSLSSGGSVIGSGSSFTTPSITSTTDYYVSSLSLEGCESSQRIKVSAIVNSIPSPPAGVDGSNCGAGTVDLSASASPGNYIWYDAPANGNVVANTQNYTTGVLPSTTTFYVVSETTGCESTRTPVVATINIIPSDPSVVDGNRCGTGTVDLSASGSPGNYGWYTNSLGGTSLSSGASYTTPSIPSTTSYYVTAISTEGCESLTRIEVVATVKSIPSDPIAVDGANCGSGTVNLSATGSPANYKWYDAPVSGVLVSSSANYTTSVLSTTTTYYVVSEATGCESNRIPVTATINTLPSAPSGTGAASCVAGSIQLSASGSPSDYNWYDNASSGTLLGSGSVFNTPVISVTTSYFVASVSPEGCESATRTTVTATLNSIPPTPNATGAENCGDGDLTLSASGSLGNYQWYDASTGGTMLSAGSSYSTGVITTTTPFYVSAVASGCESSRVKVDAVINPIPSAPSVVDDSTCSSGTVTLLASGSPETYNWYTVSSGGSAIETGSSYSTSISASSVFYVSAVSDKGCESTTRSAANAVLVPLPAEPAGSDAERCGTGQVTLNATATADSYKWYENATDQTPISGEISSSFVTPSISATTTYYVSSVKYGCESASKTAVVATVNEIPESPTGIPASICGSGVVTLSATNSPGGYLWYNEETDITSVSASATYSPTVTSTKAFYVSAIDAGCESDKVAVLATVKTIPGVPSGTGNSICGPGQVTLSASGTSQKLKWFDSSIGGTSIAEGTTFTTPSILSTTDFYVASEDDGCESSSRTSVTATIKPIPPAPTGINDSICGPGQANISAVGVSPAYRWYNELEGGTLVGNGDTYMIPFTENTITYYAVAVDNGCESDTRTPVMAYVKSVPEAPVATMGENCGTGVVTLTATASVPNLLWYDAGGTNINTGSTFTTPVLTSTTTYYVATEANGCESPVRTSVDAIIKPIPADPVATDVSRCGPGVIHLDATGATTNYIWYDAAGTLIKSSQTGFDTPEILSTTIYKVASENAGCESTNKVQVQAIINVIPAEPLVRDAERCGSGIVDLSVAGTAPTYNWYSNGNPVAAGSSWTTPSLNATTTYTVSSYDGICESEKVEIKAIVKPASIAGTLSSDANSVCSGENQGLVEASGIQGSEISWLISGNKFITAKVEASNKPEYEFSNLTQETDFKIIVKNGDCPADTSDAYTLAIDSSPMTVAGELLVEDSTASGGTLKLESQVGSVIRWESSSDGITYTPIVSTDTLFKFSISSSENYFRAVVKSGSCPARETPSFNLGEFKKIVIYSSFSPNGDGVNDTWIVDGIEAYPNNKISIFNRWGNIVYEAEGYDNTLKVWKGNANTGLVVGGESALPDGTYFYNLDWGKGKKPSTGYVVIKR